MDPIAELAFAARRLRRAPGFVFATVLMLALGTALSISMFSMLRGVLLAGLPYPGGDRVVSVRTSNPKLQTVGGGLTPAEAVQIAEAGSGQGSPFEHFGYYNWGGVTLYGGAHPRETTIVVVSDGFFPALGMQPLHGRWFSAEEHAAQQGNVVLSYEEWQRLLGGRPEAIGEMIDTSEGRLQVVGVMPPHFDYPAPSVGAWLPRGHFRSDQPAFQHARYVQAVARLKDDVAVPAARLDALAAEVRARYSLPDDGWRFASTPLLEDLVGDLRGTLWSAFALAVLVLLIACTNVAILFDGRQAARGSERALAQALGASPARIWRAAFLELALLGCTGVGLGVLGGSAALGALREMARFSVPRADAIVIDPMVLAFAIGLGLLAPCLAAVVAIRPDGNAADTLRGSGMGGKGLVGARIGVRRLLPAFAVAFSTVSLVAATAFGLSLMRLKDVDPGFRSEGVQALQMYRDGGPTAWPAFAAEVQERLAALPGVTAVALTTAAPLSTNGSLAVDVQVPGRPEPEPYRAGVRRVSAGYLHLLGIPLVAGRDLAAGDAERGEKVAIVSRELARRSFAGGSALGQTVGLPLGQGDRVLYRIVGVMEDIRNDGLRAPAAPEILIPFAQNPWASMTFLVRTQGKGPTMAAALADQVYAVDPRQAITRQFSLTGELDSELQLVRFFCRTVGAFAALALLLAGFGVYAVAALQQRRRVRELGLRLAIGARPVQLALQVLGDGLRVVALGAVLGVVGAWMALRLIAEQTFGLETQLPWVVALGVALMMLAALAALLVPAVRAARTDPMSALRYE